MPCAAVLCAALSLTLALLICPPPAAADGSIAISPSYLDVDVERGSTLPAITVRNTSSEQLEIVVQPLPAKQALSGLPDYEFNRASRRLGDKLLAIDRRRFSLRPGQSKRVRAQVKGCSQSGLGTYAVITFAATPKRETGDQPGFVQPVVRLAATTMLSYDGVCLDGELSDLSGEQGAPRQLVFTAAASNTGNLHAMPDWLSLTIRDRDGRRVYRGRFQPENVIVGATRDFQLSFKKPILPAGRYRARADMSFGGQRSSRSWDFELSAPNTLPTPRVSIGELPAPDPEPGQSFDIGAEILNTGSGAADVEVRARLSRAGAGEPFDTDSSRIDQLQPDSSSTAQFRFGGLDRGSYRFEISVQVDGREVDTKTIGFSVDEGPGLIAEINNFLAAHVLWIALVIALALIAGIALLARHLLYIYGWR